MTTGAAVSLDGGCHCGAIRVRFLPRCPVDSLVPRADQCSFCRKHNAAVVSDPGGQLEISLSGQAGTPYRFGLGITDFHVCRSCGVFVAASWNDGEDRRGVVNIHALVDRALLSQDPVAVTFDSEGVAEREARRRLHWTPVTVLRHAG